MICSRCKIDKEKNIINFPRYKVCHECLKEQSRIWANNNKHRAKTRYQKKYSNPIEKEKILKKSRKDYKNKKENNPVFFLYHAAKRRAKLKNLDFTIQMSDIVIPKNCPVLGIELKFNKKKPKDDSPSLDRINPLKGYCKDNIKVISHKANTIKSNADMNEIKLIIDYLSCGISNGDPIIP